MCVIPQKTRDIIFVYLGKTVGLRCSFKDGMTEPRRGDLLLKGGDLNCPIDEELKCFDIRVLKTSQQGCCCLPDPTTTTSSTTIATTTTTTTTEAPTSKSFFTYLRHFSRIFRYFDDDDKVPIKRIFTYRALPAVESLPLAINECHFTSPDDKTNPVKEYM